MKSKIEFSSNSLGKTLCRSFQENMSGTPRRQLPIILAAPIVIRKNLLRRRRKLYQPATAKVTTCLLLSSTQHTPTRGQAEICISILMSVNGWFGGRYSILTVPASQRLCGMPPALCGTALAAVTSSFNFITTNQLNQFTQLNQLTKLTQLTNHYSSQWYW